jgi:hypothetical protein
MRDLIGYGGKTPALAWPNGAGLAISLVVNFEEGAEQQVGDGDPASERIGEILSVVEPGTRDMGQEQIFAYGMRAGLWRFLDALEVGPRQSPIMREEARLYAIQAARDYARDENRRIRAAPMWPMQKPHWPGERISRRATTGG